MLKISRRGDYGLVLMTALARSSRSGFVSLKQAAEDSNLPYRFLGQIVASLKEAGLLQSREGKTGGYRLAKKAAAISVGDVLRVLEGPLAPVKCLKGEFCRCQKACGHKAVMIKLAQAVNEAMNRQTIGDLVRSERQKHA